MKWIGVITGDIVDSTEILNSGHRNKLLEVMHETVNTLNEQYNTETKIEIYRGDSFQIVVVSPSVALLTAIAIRAALIAASTGDTRWDARLAIGIGKGEFIAGSIAESDGEAFRLSGRAFDSLGKTERLKVETPDADFNDELSVSTAFVDDVISNWTVAQADTMYHLCLDTQQSQRELAEEIGKTSQTVNKLLVVAKSNLILSYNTRFVSKILKLE